MIRKYATLACLLALAYPGVIAAGGCRAGRMTNKAEPTDASAVQRQVEANNLQSINEYKRAKTQISEAKTSD